ncbi:MAG: hypothetical protein GY940_26155 [bacterium]|nr:hypothetical protein [bacterium]
MKRLFIYCLIVMGVLIVLSGPSNLTSQAKGMAGIKKDVQEAPATVSPDFGNIPLYFIPNEGQANEQAKFYARAAGYTLWLTKNGLVFDRTGKDKADAGSMNGETKSMKRDVSRLNFPGSRKDPEIVPVSMTQHKVNVFKGKDRSQWLTGIKTSKAVRYRELYKNIDLEVYGVETQVEYDWIVKPGGDPANIRFQYENVDRTWIDEKGNLVTETRLGRLTHQRPVSFQMVNGKKIEVSVDYKKLGSNLYGFRVGRFHEAFPLIIDPVVAVYSTFLGGSGTDYGIGLAVDSSGSAYVTGETLSSDFPVKGAYQSTISGSSDVFVSKLSSLGNSLVYSTYIGGGQTDRAEGIQVDNNGLAYITGHTASTDFPIQSPYQATYGGGSRDAFALILSASGGSLDYSTYLGGSGEDKAYAISIDDSKNLFITGHTSSGNFPTLNAYDTSLSGGTFDAFVTKINASGSSLGFSTYLGGNGTESGYGIVIKGNNAYVAGQTASTNFPTKNEYQATYGGGSYDAFVTKFATTGSSLIFSSYLGGSGEDRGYGIAVDSSGKAFVTGQTASTDFPTENAYQDTYGGGNLDAFVTSFAATGTTVEYSTFLGGTEADAAAHVNLNSSGYACITGNTSSSDFPLKKAYQTTYSGDLDVFISMFPPGGGSLNFSTFLGGGDLDTGRAIAFDNSGNIYIAGYTESSDFPTESAYEDTHQGSGDAFVAKFSTAEFGTICGAVDSCSLTWTTGGNKDWFEDTTGAHYDDDAARSGAIGNSQSTYIQTTVTGPGQLSFWWKVSSSYYDRLHFYIDGASQNYIYGTYSYINWSQKTYSIPAGTHTLKWSYVKNASYTAGSDSGWVDKVVYTPTNSIALSPGKLTFGSVQGKTSGAQTVSISNTATNTFNWTATSNKSWLSCSPESGSSSGKISVSVDAAGLGVGTYSGTVTVSSSTASNTPQTVSVTLKVYKSSGSAAPFGAYATPTDNTTVMSSVPFTGWVLDDVGVESVKLYRQSGSTMVYIGDAIFVEGSRPDVVQAYPDYPNNYKAGWGYMMLTNFLPGGGNGSFTILAIATDIEGNEVTLGSKTVTVDNANAVKPFGAIDTPTQGGPASGAKFINWGWVLTPTPNSISTDGSTINVWVDGVNLGHPTYNIYRSDIATLFPGYSNSSGAVGYYYLDTTGYSNGVHSIQWTAKDDAGNTDGIGSRFFSVQNSSPDANQSSQQDRVSGQVTLAGGFMSGQLVTGNRWMEDRSGPVGVLKGFKTDIHPGDLEMVYPDDRGNVKIEIREIDRVELHLEGFRKLSGWLKVGQQLKPLPIGSSLDRERGIFRWMAGLAFVGKYHLVFAGEDAHGNKILKNILIRITPKF